MKRLKVHQVKKNHQVVISCHKAKYQNYKNYCRYKTYIVYLPRPVHQCQTQNQKEVNHESFPSCQDMDGVSQSQFEKKIPFELTSGF